ncbi:hypothetical protein BD414DRAFT_458190 [Trametes punicea]|nr:hypothetical protein BD414DRAFT_458190 [Trametes punicea]
MSDLEIVIEAPQSTQRNKKRPRLVTSCDHCRVKKIKCIQRPFSGSCEACLAAKLPCLYRDREQYFAERTRLLSGPPAGHRDASSSAQAGGQLSAINASAPVSRSALSRPPTSSSTSSDAISTSSTPSNSSASGSESPPLSLHRSNPPGYYPFVDMTTMDFGPFQDLLGGFTAHATQQAPQDPLQSLAWCPPRDPALHSSLATQAPPMQIPSMPSSSSSLFDPNDPIQPHPKLMMDFIHVFFENLGTTYTFLCPAAICQDFLNQRLSPLLANALAGSAARFSTMPEIRQIGPANVADVYCQMAKYLIPPNGPPATLETLHAVMLLAWAEHQRGRHMLFNAYARTSMRLANELDITPISLPTLMQSINHRMNCLLQATLENIQLMERTMAAAQYPNLTLDSGPGTAPAGWQADE